ncbi:MAG: type III-A CRISPR-associated protein Csm2 [Chlorobiaceae bacterium]|nr:type III-A CRISPR-associated protein Csm2 [Chlorobiaceae bacterium]
MSNGQNQQYSVDDEKELLKKLTDSLVLDYSADTYQKMIDTVKKYSEILVSGRQAVTTTQLRNIYTSVKKAKKPEELLPLQVKLAYLAGRNESNYRLKALADRLSSLIKNVKTETQLAHFVEFFTALIAYQKYHEKFSSNKH